MKTIKERIEQKIERTKSGCWLWRGALFSDGYGQLRVDGKLKKAHRVSWEEANGPVPEGLFLLHGPCHNRGCVNPEHLRVGTKKENAEDRKRDGSEIYGERQGSSKLTEACVHLIRFLSKEGNSQKSLGRMFGVSQTTIHCVVTRKSWPHV